MPTLYRKYRPQNFSDIVSQDHIVQTIENEIALGRIAHAYLFSGPRGVGKTTLARLLAKAVNCEKRKDGTFEPCEECSSCQEISAGRNIDVIEIDAASHTGVDNVRENIIENAQFKPTKSKYKIFIIDEVHMLSASAFNALLKTLEEPPAHVVFVLATTEFHKLPATVVSRCQRFTFKKIPHDLMREKLEKICKEEDVKVDKDVLGRIINKSDGALRDAESLLGQILTINKKKITAEDVSMILPTSDIESLISFLKHLLNKDAPPALQLISSLTEAGTNLEQFAYELTELLRVILLHKAGLALDDIATDYSREHAKEIQKLAGLIASVELIELIDALIKRKLEIKAAPLPQLPLELLAVEWISKNDKPSSGSPMPVETKHASSLQQSDEPTMPSSPPPADPRHTLTDSIKNVISTITHHRKPITTSLEAIQNSWDDMINAIATTAPSLTFILRMCKPERVDHDGLHLTVPYRLHRDKLIEAKNKKIIEDSLAQKFSETIPLVCDVAAEAAPANDPELAALAVEFGGEVVN